MTLDDIAVSAVSTVGLTGEDFDLNIAKGFVRVRHQQVYESFDWKAAQDLIILPFDAGTPSQEVPTAETVLSARWNSDDGKKHYLDPVSTSYLFESLPDLIAEGNGITGVPQFFLSRYSTTSHNVTITLAPTPADDGSVLLLIKRKFDANSDEPLVPNIDEVLLQFTISDLWNYMRQVGMAGEVLKNAQALLAAAQARDVPTTPKPRTSKVLSPSGDTLGEMTDAVCDIVGRWEPDIRESIRDRIRREYRQLHDMLMLPESLIIASVPVDLGQEQVVLPYYFDRVIEVRTNKTGPFTATTQLANKEISYFFNVNKDIFEQSGQPVNYTMLSTIGVEVMPPIRERLQFSTYPTLYQDVGTELFIKGLSSGQERSENVKLPAPAFIGTHGPDSLGTSAGPSIPQPDMPGPQNDPGWVTTTNFYDLPLVITKPDTTSSVYVRGASSHRLLLHLEPKEHERKHLRIWLLPNLTQGAGHDVTNAGSVLVLGKRKMSPLVEEGDSPEIRNVSNIIIHAAASAILDRLGNAELANKYGTKAAAESQALIDAEMKQNAYNPVILPFADRNDTELDCF